MDSRTSQFAADVDTDTDARGLELQHAGDIDKPGPTPVSWQERANADTEARSVCAQADNDPEIDQSLNKTRFALLFTCILLGSFLIGYVRADLP